MIYRKDVEKVKNNLTPTAHNDIILDLCNYWLKRNQEMSIKKIVSELFCFNCGNNLCSRCDDWHAENIEKYTQQIISEIVQELEKIQKIYSGDTNAINLCIKIIKKMGEV